MPHDWLTFDAQTTAGILVMALVTYGLKLAGYTTQRLVTPGPRVARFLDALPGTVILSLTVPMALSSGVEGLVGLCFGLAIMAKTGNVLLATGLGYAFALATRYLIGV